MDLITLIIIFIIGFGSSFIANIAGSGGGIISIPLLIMLGLPPQFAVATKRFSSLGSEIITTIQYVRASKIVWRYAIPISVFTLIATVIGASILVEIDNDLLEKIIGFVILLAIPFTFVKKGYGLKRKRTSKARNYIGYALYFIVDITDTFIGAVGGTFTTLILISLMGLTYLESNATKKIAGLTMAIVGSTIFAYYGIINYTWGLALMAGMMFGGYLGVRISIKKGSYLVKIVFSIIVIISAIKLILF